MNLFFPQLQCALVVRKTRPENGRLVTSWGDQSVYLVETSTCPRGCHIAEGALGGWNYPSGECISLVYARRFSSLTLFCEREQGDKLVKTRQLGNGLFVNLVRVRTGMTLSIGCTPTLAEDTLSKDE